MEYVRKTYSYDDCTYEETFRGEAGELIDFIEYLDSVKLDDLLDDLEEDLSERDDIPPFSTDEEGDNIANKFQNDLARETGECSCGNSRQMPYL